MKQILETVKAKLGIDSAGLSKRSGLSQAILSAWKLKDSTTVNLGLLARLRRVSGLTWAKFGEMIDQEVGK